MRRLFSLPLYGIADHLGVVLQGEIRPLEVTFDLPVNGAQTPSALMLYHTLDRFPMARANYPSQQFRLPP